jgi:hypothetical protein
MGQHRNMLKHGRQGKRKLTRRSKQIEKQIGREKKRRKIAERETENRERKRDRIEKDTETGEKHS